MNDDGETLIDAEEAGREADARRGAANASSREDVEYGGGGGGGVGGIGGGGFGGGGEGGEGSGFDRDKKKRLPRTPGVKSAGSLLEVAVEGAAAAAAAAGDGSIAGSPNNDDRPPSASSRPPLPPRVPSRENLAALNRERQGEGAGGQRGGGGQGQGQHELMTSPPPVRRKEPPREFRVGICNEGEILSSTSRVLHPRGTDGGARGGLSDGSSDGFGLRVVDDDDGLVGLTFTDVFELINPRLLFAGGVNVVGCMAFGVVQPMLSLYLARSPLSWDERGVGWAQGCVSLGYMLGVRPAHRAVARGVRAEGLCSLGTLLSGLCLLRIGAGAASAAAGASGSGSGGVGVGGGGGGVGGVGGGGGHVGNDGGVGEWEMLVTLFCFGLAQSAALVPTLEAGPESTHTPHPRRI